MSKIKQYEKKKGKYEKEEYSSKQVFYRLLAYVKHYKAGFLLSVIGMIGFAAMDALFIYSIKPLVDQGINAKNVDVLRLAPYFVVIAFLFRGAFSFISSYGLSWIGGNMVMILRQKMFNHMLELPVSFFDKNSKGSLISQITYNTEQVFSATSSALVVIVREGTFTIGLLILMFYQSWQLSLVFVVIGPLVGLVATIVGKRFRKISKNIQNAIATVTTNIEQMLGGHRIILTFGGKKFEQERFKKNTNRARQQRMKMMVASSLSVPAIQLIASMAIVVVLVMASSQVLLEQLTAGTFTVIITSMIMILRPLKQLSTVNEQFQRGMTAGATIFELLDIAPEKNQGTFYTKRSQGNFSIKNLSFAYQDKKKLALDNISLNIRSGEKVAFVGTSGSGKTTLSNLLPRFYDFKNGNITLDNKPIFEYELHNLREQFSIVSQNVTLFDDTVLNNIKYAKTDATEDDIKKAASLANASEFIEKLPQKYDSIIGENGVTLSGGQKQRLAIARTILKDAPILILDEATSALDTESEKYIQNAIFNVLDQKTAIIIAHRLSTIIDADKIVVFADGKIKETGTHKELLAINGLYAKLYKLQYAS